MLITGASGGLGRSIARRFAGEGAEIVLSGRRTDVLEHLADELRDRGGARRVEVVTADLDNRDAVRGLADAAGAIDVFIANAALPASGQLASFSQSQIDTLLEVNLRSQIALTRALVPGMLARGRGHLAFVSSLGGKAASPAASIYNASKFGLRGFALGLRQDLRSAGVGVSVILPGFISDAGMFADSNTELPPGVGTRTAAQVADAVLEAVVRDRAEVSVAPPILRLGADLASIVPEFSARMQRLLGGAAVAERVVAGQADKRP